MGILVLNALGTAAWLFVLTRMDRNRKDKKGVSRILIFYFAGLLSIIPSFLLYFIFPYRLFSVNSEPLAYLILGILITGPIEEFSKFIVFYLFSRRFRSLKEPLDGVLQAAAVALAFATVENVIYTANYGIWVLPIRFVLATTGHLVYAAIWGLYSTAVTFGTIGKGGRGDQWIIFLSILPAANLHGLHNFFLDIGLFPLAIALDVGILVLAVLIYRLLARKSPYRAPSLAHPLRSVQELREALTHHPNSLVLNRRLALLYLYLGKYDTALQLLQRCRRLHPHSQTMRCLIGVALILSGQVERGEALLRASYRRLGPAQQWRLRRSMARLLAQRSPERNGAERYNLFFLSHFFRFADNRA